MRNGFLALMVLMTAAASDAAAQSAADSAAIVQTALDYVEGWYSGDAERMQRALHPELAKRIVVTDATTNKSSLREMGAEELIEGTRSGYGTRIPKEAQQKDVTILDVYEGAASVRIVASSWIDYLHVARYEGRWVIVNVLWELKPES